MDKVSAEEVNRITNIQYTTYGGFCAYCGEACRPFYYKLWQDWRDTACPYNGEHPDCGNHVMKLILKPSETLGEYEV